MADDSAAHAVQIASQLGSRPSLLLGLMIGAAVGAIATMALVVRVADRHARKAWARAAVGWRWLAERPAMQSLERRLPWVWRAMRRLTATEYLVLHMIVGFVITGGALSFLAIAAAVGGREVVVDVDLALADALWRSSTPAGVQVLQVFTKLGGGIFIAAVGIAVGAVLVVRRRFVLAAGWAIALAGGGVLNRGLKAVYARPRPSFEQPVYYATGYSFPSGHAMATFVLVGMASYLGWRLARTMPRRMAIVALASSWAVAMGFSRMYLGAHYLSDVVAGFVAGGMWVAACISGLEIALRRPRVPALDASTRPPPDAMAGSAAG